jgi:hypothetical protein
MTTKPSVSIIIVNYNEREYLENCLKSILENTGDINYEVIVVDNGSSDGSVEFLKQLSIMDSRIRVIALKKNVGYSSAINIGYRNSNGSLIALLSNDTQVTRGWLTSLIQTLNSDKEIGCVQSKLLLMDYPSRIDSLGHILDPLGFLRPKGYMELDKGQFDNYDDICVVQVVACLLKRSVIEKIGLFDDDYFIMHEDTDLSLRLHMAGYKIILVPTSIVYHKRLLTISKMPPEIIIYLTRRNSLMTILKNYEVKNLIRYMPLVILIYFGMGAWYITRGEAGYFKALFSAMLWNIRNLKRTFEKRAFVQAFIRTIPDCKIFNKFDGISLNRLRKRTVSLFQSTYVHPPHEK